MKMILKERRESKMGNRGSISKFIRFGKYVESVFTIAVPNATQHMKYEYKYMCVCVLEHYKATER